MPFPTHILIWQYLLLLLLTLEVELKYCFLCQENDGNNSNNYLIAEPNYIAIMGKSRRYIQFIFDIWSDFIIHLLIKFELEVISAKLNCSGLTECYLNNVLVIGHNVTLYDGTSQFNWFHY